MRISDLSGTVHALAAALVLFCASSSAQQKQIRLRNEVITTPLHGPQAAAIADPLSVGTGLFLVQFTDRFDPAWRDPLRAQRVRLLRYVPDDAFVARFDNVRLAAVRALPFVHWVCEYRAEHKIHASLRETAGAPPAGLRAAASEREVSVLLSPDATAQEIVQAQQFFSSVAQQSESRFGAILRGRVRAGRVVDLARSPQVLWIEPWSRVRLFDAVATGIVAGNAVSNRPVPHLLGFTGTGVKVAVADSGLCLGTTNDLHPDFVGRVTNFFFYGSLTDAADRHGHGTHVTGIVAGDGAAGETDENGWLYGLGVAPRAGVVVQRIFNELGQLEAPSNEQLTRDAVQAGAEIGSNSWGTDSQGQYDLNAQEFDALVRDADASTPGEQPYVIEFSAGNAGPARQTIGSPAVAKNVIATGASQSSRTDGLVHNGGPEAMANFSSRGPCEDGRIKPDLVAPGTWIASARSPLAPDFNAWARISDEYIYDGGTSQSGAHVSGAAAVLIQWFRETQAMSKPSPALVKAALINSAVNLAESAGTAPAPNMDEGWGRLNLTDIFTGSRRYEFLDQTVLLTNGQVYERRVIVADAGRPLKITLAYTDVPGLPAAIPALVNDLDLELVGPDGTVYRGNQFDAGGSVPNAGSSDARNNVEGVCIAQPRPGDYLLRVRARNVAQDACGDTPGLDQDFALVVSGGLAPPGMGVVVLDRATYTVPDWVIVKVIDSDLAGQSSVGIRVSSSADAAPEPLTLVPDASGIVFTGAIATATGPGTLDGRLQVVNGSTICGEYADASAGTIRVANAVADLVPPVITKVYVTNIFGKTFVRWITSEPANAVVQFGTGLPPSSTVTNRTFEGSHEVELRGLTGGLTYYYAVISRDAAGNAATNGAGIAYYQFTAISPALVLLVNSYTQDSQSEFIPVSAYTNAITEAGVSVQVWDVPTLGASPTLADLFNYKIVIWRLNDSFRLSPRDTISTADQATILAYLGSGGAFFLASMEIPSTLLDAGWGDFVTNVLHVGQFVRNPDLLTPCPTCDENAGVPTIEGVTGDVIGDGVVATLDYSHFPSIEFQSFGPDLSDTFTPTTNATAVLLDGSSGRSVGVRYPRTGEDSTGRVVFLSFPIEAVPTNPPPSSRSGLLRNVFQFLSPGLGGLGSIAIDKRVYGVPDLVTVEVADSDLIGQGSATATFVSTSDSNAVTVTLQETVRPGLFRGYLTVVAVTNAPGAGRLRVADGNTIYGSYFDASGPVIVTASALVDGVVPVISDLVIHPEYEEAEIVWTTSEPTDALVQYGESALLGRTAYQPALDFTHSNLLSGLVPDRTYFYRVVSRDAAGNLAVDDNGGQLHTFRTLRPEELPFVDDGEAGMGQWEVFAGPGSESQWTLGTPNNDLVFDAHSPVNAWGSSLAGTEAAYIDTSLLSPALNLTGGNKALLQFWHSYDFSRNSGPGTTNYGELLLITNSASPPVPIATFTDALFGWEPCEIDLSPYVGRTVYLVWHHVLNANQIARRPGWTIDDVSVSITNLAPGVVIMTNNLAEARFVLSGPINRADAGITAIYTNAIPGNYRITWLDVPWFQTPAPQILPLEPGGTLRIFGQYTFADANDNSISDPWEIDHFSTVDPGRTSTTDTDGDGWPDSAEFLGGTDPNSPASNLRCTVRRLPSGQVEMSWSSMTSRQYRVLGSADAVVFAPMSDWQWGNGNTMTHLLPAAGPGVPYLFKVEVRP